MPKRAKLPVCVQYRWSEAMDRLAGWCISEQQPARLTENAREQLASRSDVRTLCGMTVIYPVGVERRRPTCNECLKKWSER